MRDLPTKPMSEDVQTLVEEMACTIAEAQAALFAGRFRDLENCARRQQELCVAFKSLEKQIDSEVEANPDSPKLITMAEQARQDNRVFGAALGRMRRHLETLQNVLSGPSATYKPGQAPVTDSEP